jgi:prophage regulatory protein
MDSQNSSEGRRWLERLPAVMARTGMGRSWIYREIGEGRFPAPVKVGGASCWDAGAIDAWIAVQVGHAERPKP